MTELSPDTVNYMVWRFLEENGFSHTSFTFAHESGLDPSSFPLETLPYNAMLTLIAKGQSYIDLESQAIQQVEINNVKEELPIDMTLCTPVKKIIACRDLVLVRDQSPLLRLMRPQGTSVECIVTLPHISAEDNIIADAIWIREGSAIAFITNDCHFAVFDVELMKIVYHTQVMINKNVTPLQLIYSNDDRTVLIITDSDMFCAINGEVVVEERLKDKWDEAVCVCSGICHRNHSCFLLNLLSSSGECRAGLYDFSTRKFLLLNENQMTVNGLPRSLVWSCDMSVPFIALNSKKGVSVINWSSYRNIPFKELCAIDCGVYCSTISFDNDRLIVGCVDECGIIHLISKENGEVNEFFTSVVMFKSDCWYCAIRRSIFVAMSSDGTIATVDMKNRNQVKVHNLKKPAVSAAIMNGLMYVGYIDGTVGYAYDILNNHS